MHYKLMRDKLNLLLAIMVLLAVPFSAARSLAAPGLPKTKPTRALPQNAAPNRLTPAASLAMVQDERDRYWLHAKQEVYKSVLELLAQNEDELQHGMRASKFMHGDTGRKWIALTFDDGPHPAYTPKLLQILSRYNAKATFFVVA
jgi:peptidoglycan/xylan/chitin deacetylase (PgdA/CDA1 family)